MGEAEAVGLVAARGAREMWVAEVAGAGEEEREMAVVREARVVMVVTSVIVEAERHR